MGSYREETRLITHYYFCSGVLHYLSQQDRAPGELFGSGEIELIHGLCEYSQIISDIEQTKSHDKGFPGVFDYEVSEDYAARLWIELCDKASEGNHWDFPDQGEFRFYVELLIDDWLSEPVSGRLDIALWLKEKAK